MHSPDPGGSAPHLAAALAAWLAAAGGAPALAQATGPLDTVALPRSSTSSVEVRAAIPEWVAMPPTARILTSAGLDLRPLRNSAVTYENARLGVLVGALDNVGACARNLRIRLQYTDHRWRPLGEAIENEARVSGVGPGGALPYRFRLKRNDDFAEPPSGYILQVAEDGKPVAETLEWVAANRQVERTPCAPGPVTIAAAVTQSRSTLRGYRVSGTLTVIDGGPIRADAVTITALLRDAGGDVLEVLTGVPAVGGRDTPGGLIENGRPLPFSLSTVVPLGGSVASTTLFTEVLPDARVSPARP